jgi:hypothetical protein
MRAQFATHKLNLDGLKNAADIAKTFDATVDELLQCGCAENCREWSIAMTKLEEACFFAKKAMAINVKYNEEK